MAVAQRHQVSGANRARFFRRGPEVQGVIGTEPTHTADAMSAASKMNTDKPAMPDMIERVERVLMASALAAGVVWSVLGEAGVWRLAALLRAI